MGTSQVALVKCTNYEQEIVNRAIRQSVDFIGGMRRYLKPGDVALLKVNLLSAGEGVHTHPSVARAVIELVKEVGGVPVVADTPGVFHVGNEATTAMVTSGLEAVAKEAGCKAFQFETRGFAEVPVLKGKKLHSIYAAKTALEADVIISLPKLKTHGLTLFTGAVKNMFGTVSPRTRRTIHAQQASAKDFSEALVDIYSVVKPRLTIMDGVIGMEGEGPAHGDLKPVGVILASADGVALDAVASRMVGFEPMEIQTTRVATDRGLGNGDMGGIKVLGERVEDVTVTFKRPPSWQSNLPPWLMSLINRLAYVRPQVDVEKCVQCGVCAKSCPVEALRLAPYPTFNREKCIECYCCNELCPKGAIVLERSWLARVIAAQGR